MKVTKEAESRRVETESGNPFRSDVANTETVPAAYEAPRVTRTGSLHHLLGKSGPFVDLFGAQPTQP